MTYSLGLELLIGLATTFYVLVVIALTIGLGRLRYQPSADKPTVSIIVAARNEQDKLGDLLKHLVKQEYPSYEVIIVNDRSTDRTPEIIEQYRAAHANVRRIDVTSTSTRMPAKKHALSLGIAASKGTILCLTDADCLPPPRWISSLVSAFDNDTGLVAGYSPYVSDPVQDLRASVPIKVLHAFVRYEEFKGATWSAASIGLQRGWLCTGRSLAYRRKVYDEVGGFDKIKKSISGDDDLFLQLVRQSTSWKIRYVTSYESFVPSEPPARFREFLQQRIRHFSAGKFFPMPMKIFFFFFHASNLILLLSLIDALTFGASRLAAWPFILKCLADSLLFFRAAAVFNHLHFVWTFLVWEIAYIFYNTFVGPLGFIARIEWKTENRTS